MICKANRLTGFYIHKFLVNAISEQAIIWLFSNHDILLLDKPRMELKQLYQKSLSLPSALETL